MKLKIAITALLATLPITSAQAQTANTPAPDQARASFDQVDANKDGALTLEEWKAAGRRERGFRMIDTDRDGKVTPAELQAAMAKYNRSR